MALRETDGEWGFRLDSRPRVWFARPLLTPIWDWNHPCLPALCLYQTPCLVNDWLPPRRRRLNSSLTRHGDRLVLAANAGKLKSKCQHLMKGGERKCRIGVAIRCAYRETARLWKPSRQPSKKRQQTCHSMPWCQCQRNWTRQSLHLMSPTGTTGDVNIREPSGTSRLV